MPRPQPPKPVTLGIKPPPVSKIVGWLDVCGTGEDPPLEFTPRKKASN